MALSASVVLEVRSTGSDTNGGGFRTGATGTDWSQQASAQYSVTDGVTNGTTTITSATANFGTDVVGNLIYVQGGTGSITADWYEITSRTNSTTIVVDRSTGLTTGTGVTLKIGGALASPGQAAAIKNKTAGITVYIKNGTYTLTTSSSNVAGGRIDDTAGGVQNGQGGWIGYDTTRSRYNTDANRPTISAGAVTSLTNGILYINGSYNSNLVSNRILDANSGSSNVGIKITNTSLTLLKRCHVANAAGGGFYIQGSALLDTCSATGCSTTPAFFTYQPAGATFVNCHAYANSIHGFGGDGAATYINCYSTANTGSAKGWNRVVNAYGTDLVMVGCVAYNNASDGVYVDGNCRSGMVHNTISISNGGYGFSTNTAGTNSVLFRNCATYNNTSGAFNSNLASECQIGSITLSGNPFTNAGSNDFSLDNTASEGAALRGIGMAVPPSLTHTDYSDVGGAQHQDSGGGGGTTVAGCVGFLGGFQS